MSSYDKWDKLAADVSDDEQEEAEKKLLPRHPGPTDDWQRIKEDQEQIFEWLGRQQLTLRQREADMMAAFDKAHQGPSAGPPELEDLAAVKKKFARKWRDVSKEERSVLAMLVSLSYFESGETNLHRHPQLLDLMRQNRWLEEDPGTLELLCQVHGLDLNYGTKATGDKNAPEQRFRSMVICGINTLAAAPKSGCKGGFLELVTLICTPDAEKAKEFRTKWEKKEFGKEALLASVFPELKTEEPEEGNMEFWMMVGTGIASLIGLILLVLLIRWAPETPPLADTESEL